MKFLAVFAALVAVAASHSTWTLSQLDEAISNPNTDPALLPYLEQALNEMMDALFAGHPLEPVTVTIPAVDLSSWTLNELSDALQNPNTDPALVPYLEQALNALMEAIFDGTPVAVMPVAVPAMDITSWTLHELSEALQDPATDPALVPYLEHALNEMMDALISGHGMESITIAIPAGLVPVVPAPVEPSPVVPAPVVPSPVVVPTPSPVSPAPIETPAPVAFTSPLVQIIVNVNQQQQAPVTPAVVPEPVADISPEPVHVVDGTPVAPEPVHVVDSTPVAPEPVHVVDSTPVAPEPVIVAEPVVPEPVVVAPIVEEPVESVPIGVVVPIAPAA